MESKFKDPGKRMLQLAVRDAISSKLSLNSSFKRELDKKKQCRGKINEKKKVPIESLVTKEMAEIYKSLEEEKAKIGYNFKTNLNGKPSKETYLKKETSRSLSAPLLPRSNFVTNVPESFNDSDRSSTKKSSSKLKKSASSDCMPLPDLLEKHLSENLKINEKANEELYIPPPHYPDSFLMSPDPVIFPENTINSPFVENKKNCLSITSPDYFPQHFFHRNTYFHPENKKHCLDVDNSYKLFSPPKLKSSGTILLASDNPESTIVEDHHQNSQNLFWELKKSINNTSRYKQLSPKKNDEDEYINSLIDSFINKNDGSPSTKQVEKSIHKEHHMCVARKAEDAAFDISTSSSPLDRASMYNSQNTCDVSTVFLNFKMNVCKKQESVIEKNNANLTDENDTILSSHNEISVAVLCEFFKLHTMLN